MRILKGHGYAGGGHQLLGHGLAAAAQFGPNLVVPGGWTLTSATDTSGVIEATAETGLAQQLSILTSGVLYRVEFTISGRTGGDVDIGINTYQILNQTGNTDYSFDLTSTGVDLNVRMQSFFDGALSNISIREIL